MNKFFLIFICVISLTFATNDSWSAVKNFDNKLSIALVTDDNNFNLQFKPDDLNFTGEVNYAPNTTTSSGFQVSYGGITLAYLTKTPFTENSITAKGKTSYEDFRGAFFFRQAKTVCSDRVLQSF